MHAKTPFCFHCWKNFHNCCYFQSWWFTVFSTGFFAVFTISGIQLFILSGNGVNHFHFSGERNLRCIQSCGSSDLPTRIHPHLRYRSFIFMIRAARHASQHRVRFLLDQLLFYYRLKLLMLELQFRLEETLDTLYDLGFENHDITRDLDVAHRANQLFMGRCSAAMTMLQDRLLDTFLRRLHV